MNIKEAISNPRVEIPTIPEINSKNGEDLPDDSPQKTNITDQIDNSKLDTTVPGGASKQNRYKQNKYLNEIEEEASEKKLPVLPIAPIIQNPAVQPGLRSTMYKNLYGINNTS